MSWQLIIVGIFGACFGSFLNVLSGRFGESQSLVTGRSRCPHCRRQLRWWELVPVVSFLLLRGKCARCQKRISLQYPIVELLTAAAWVWVFWNFPTTGQDLAVALTLAVILSILLVLFLIDRRLMLLPDIYLLYLSLAVFIYLWLQPPPAPASHVAGVVVGTGFLFLLWLATAGRGIGFGDIKLMIPLGLLFGLTSTVALLWIAFIVGGIFAAYLLVRRRGTMKTAVAFGPFLIAAAVAILVWPNLPSLLFAVWWS